MEKGVKGVMAQNTAIFFYTIALPLDEIFNPPPSLPTRPSLLQQFKMDLTIYEGWPSMSRGLRGVVEGNSEANGPGMKGLRCERLNDGEALQ